MLPCLKQSRKLGCFRLFEAVRWSWQPSESSLGRAEGATLRASRSILAQSWRQRLVLVGSRVVRRREESRLFLDGRWRALASWAGRVVA